MASQSSDPNAATASLPAAVYRILEARHHDPFQVLGRHREGNQDVVRAFLPYCREVRIEENGKSLTRLGDTDLFEWHGPAGTTPDRYRLTWQDSQGAEHVAYDPYCFPPQVSDFDLHLFGEGRHWHVYRILGAHRRQVDGVYGVLFAVWAPSIPPVAGYPKRRC